MLSYQYLPDDGGNTTVEHWYPAKKVKKVFQERFEKVLTILLSFFFYDLFMGAVDLFDQYRQYIKLELRSRKFWHPLFWFVIESAMVNAWVLYQATRVAGGLELEFDHIEFRRCIAFALAAEWEAMGCQYSPSGLVTPTKQLKHTKKGTRASLKKNACNLQRSFDNNKHVEFMTLIPQAEGANRKYRQQKCRQCLNHRTASWCSSCKVSLCKSGQVFPSVSLECLKVYPYI